MAKLHINLENMARRSDKRLTNPSVVSKIQKKELSLDAAIVNLSRRGLRFKSSTEYKKGEKIMFELNSNDQTSNLSLTIKAKIVNDYGPNRDGVHEYGVKFSRTLYWYEMNCIHNYVYQCEKAREAEAEARAKAKSDAEGLAELE